MKYEVYDSKEDEVITAASLARQLDAWVEKGYRQWALSHWAWPVYVFRIEGFALAPDGQLYLMDKCGNYIYPPEHIKARPLTKRSKAAK